MWGNSYDIAFPVPGDSSKIVIPGYAGAICRSEDSAASFILTYDAAVSTNHNSGAAFAGDTGRGYIVHGGGGMIESTDFGASWHRHPTQDLEVKGVDVDFSDNTHGIVGITVGNVWVTQDSGVSWVSYNTGMTGTVTKIDHSDTDPLVFIVVSSVGETARTEDGGLTWTSTGVVVASPLNEVSFADENVVFIGADSGAVLMSRDTGRTWTTIRPGGGVPSVGGMWVRDANHIWIGGLSGANYRVTGS
jgi:hypothetical protein